MHPKCGYFLMVTLSCCHGYGGQESFLFIQSRQQFLIWHKTHWAFIFIYCWFFFHQWESLWAALWRLFDYFMELCNMGVSLLSCFSMATLYLSLDSSCPIQESVYLQFIIILGRQKKKPSYYLQQEITSVVDGSVCSNQTLFLWHLLWGCLLHSLCCETMVYICGCWNKSPSSFVFCGRVWMDLQSGYLLLGVETSLCLSVVSTTAECHCFATHVVNACSIIYNCRKCDLLFQKCYFQSDLVVFVMISAW